MVSGYGLANMAYKWWPGSDPQPKHTDTDTDSVADTLQGWQQQGDKQSHHVSSSTLKERRTPDAVCRLPFNGWRDSPHTNTNIKQRWWALETQDGTERNGTGRDSTRGLWNPQTLRSKGFWDTQARTLTKKSVCQLEGSNSKIN